jgi:hypothetical protein
MLRQVVWEMVADGSEVHTVCIVRAMMMEEMSTYDKSDFYEVKQCRIPEGYLHTRRRKNPKCQKSTIEGNEQLYRY